MKRTLMTLIMIAFLAVAAMATAGTAAANEDEDGHHCHRNQITTIIGSSGHDRLVGTRCNDYIYGIGGRDTVIGRAGEDHLFGGRGPDALRAVDGYTDSVNGGRGFDRCRGDQLDSFRRCEVISVFFVGPAHH